MTPAGHLTTLYSFTGGADGAIPTSMLVRGADGDLYGTTLYGTASHNGTAFKISVPMAPGLVGISRAQSATVLTWSAVSNSPYQVQYKSNLTQASWINLGSIIVATNGVGSTTDAASSTTRFYRVMLAP